MKINDPVKIKEPTKIRNWHKDHQQGLTTGQRAADVLRNAMGSWRFIGSFIAIMAVWAMINTLLLRRDAFDPYPYILLNLFLSMLAGLQGAILLIASKRQDSISATMAQHDYDTNVAARQEIDRLLEIGEQHRQMLAELRTLVEETAQARAADQPAPR
jgi:uncharacterized membrane protein